MSYAGPCSGGDHDSIPLTVRWNPVESTHHACHYGHSLLDGKVLLLLPFTLFSPLLCIAVELMDGYWRKALDLLGPRH